MIDYKIISYKESKICIFENKFTSEELLNKFSQPEIYLPDMKRLISEHRKKEFLGLRLALKYCCDGNEKKIIHTAEGKPVLADSSCKISFSHCKDWVAAMIHPLADVGIDIERPTERLWGISSRFLGKEEKLDLLKINELDYLRITWSAKEALFKIIGESAYNFAEQLRILPFALTKEGELTAVFTQTGKLFTVNYLLTNEFSLAYCIDNE